jgi:hypothetical protein
MEPINIASDVSVQMAFACENFSTDPLGRITFHSIIEQFNAIAFPTQTPLLFVVFGFQRTVPGFLVDNKVEIVPQQGMPLASQAIPDMAFRPDQMVQRHITGFQGIVWPQPGEYTARFTSRGKTLASFLLRVVAIQPGQIPG